MQPRVMVGSPVSKAMTRLPPKPPLSQPVAPCLGLGSSTAFQSISLCLVRELSLTYYLVYSLYMIYI